MPIYEYVCRDCGEKFEKLVSRTQDSVSCPRCQSLQAEKLFSAFGIAGAVRFSPSTGASGCASCNSASCAGCSSAAR